MIAETSERPGITAPAQFWVPFTDAERAVETLLSVASEAPDERPPCVVLSGPSGMGKSAILRETQRRMLAAYPKPEALRDTRYEPMLRAIVPSRPSSVKINLMLLWKQGWPIRSNSALTADSKVVELLRLQRTRLIAIDQVHTILTASGATRRDTLDAFRFLMTEGQIPMVVAGIARAAEIFEADEELAARSISIKLSPWPPGEASQRMIRSLARGLRLSDPDRLAEPDIASRISELSHGITGNVSRILRWSAKVAAQRGGSDITIDDINVSVAQFTPYLLKRSGER